MARSHDARQVKTDRPKRELPPARRRHGSLPVDSLRGGGSRLADRASRTRSA